MTAELESDSPRIGKGRFGWASGVSLAAVILAAMVVLLTSGLAQLERASMSADVRMIVGDQSWITDERVANRVQVVWSQMLEAERARVHFEVESALHVGLDEIFESLIDLAPTTARGFYAPAMWLPRLVVTLTPSDEVLLAEWVESELLASAELEQRIVALQLDVLRETLPTAVERSATRLADDLIGWFDRESAVVRETESDDAERTFVASKVGASAGSLAERLIEPELWVLAPPDAWVGSAAVGSILAARAIAPAPLAARVGAVRAGRVLAPVAGPLGWGALAASVGWVGWDWTRAERMRAERLELELQWGLLALREEVRCALLPALDGALLAAQPAQDTVYSARIVDRSSFRVLRLGGDRRIDD
ncbi:MAG: hypothetical protein ACK4IT_00170 [Thioalkalivibrionaceae bacterium]